MAEQVYIADKSPKLFGAYVVSASTSLSWGSQGASSQFKLVQDPDNGVIIDIPPIGSPVIFPPKEYEVDANGEKVLKKFGNFDYSKPLSSGFLQRATYSESLSGRFYDVIIQSPATILSGVQVILSNFDGNGSGGILTNEIANILNVCGFYENFQFGSTADLRALGIRGGFGNSAVDDMGFPLRVYTPEYSSVVPVDIFQTIVEMTYDPEFSYFGGPIRHGNYSYELNFEELATAINLANIWHYRISGDVRDLASMITEVCDLMQVDWMIQLEDRSDDPTNPRPRPTLVLKLMDRSFAPPLIDIVDPNDPDKTIKSSIIKEYIKSVKGSPQITQACDASTPCPDGYGCIDGFCKPVDSTLISCSYGQELSDATTAKIVVGAPVSRYIDQPLDNCVPVWGRTKEGHWQLHPKTPLDLQYPTASQVYTKANLWNSYVYFPINIPGYGTYNTTLFELRMLTGAQPKKSWSFFKSFQQAAGREPNGWDNTSSSIETAPWFRDTKMDVTTLNMISQGQIVMQDAYSTLVSKKAYLDQFGYESEAEYKLFFDGLLRIARDCFCRQFMAPVPLDLEDPYYNLSGPQIIDENIRFINTYGDLEAEQFETSWSVTSDAWARDPQVGRADFFNNGRLKAMVGFKKEIPPDDWGGGRQPGSDEAVNVGELGDNWVFSRTYPNQQSNPNRQAWHGMPSFQGPMVPNPHTGGWGQVVYNPWAAGTGQSTVLGVTSNILSLDGGPAENIIYPYSSDPATMFVPCSTSVSPVVDDGFANSRFGLTVLAKYFFLVDIDPSVYAVPNNDHLAFEVPLLRTLPIGFGIPQQSNKYSYGPWVRFAATDITIPNPDYDDDPDLPPDPINNPTTISSYLAGKAQVEFDPSLAPETFGGFGGMDEAGFALSKIGVGRVDISETGFVELVGTPIYNIGQRFLDSGPFVTDLDISVGTDGIKSTYKFNTWTPSFGKLAKYNIDILSRIGQSSFKNITAGRNALPSMPVAGSVYAGSNPSTGQLNPINLRHAQAIAQSYSSSIFSFYPDSMGTIPTPAMIGFSISRGS